MNLEAYLAQQGINAKLIHLGKQTTTATMAAEALGVPIEVVIKSILFQTKDGALLLVVAQGTGRIDTQKLAQATGIDGWRLAKPEVVLDATGFPAGGTPPVGLKRKIRTIVDTQPPPLQKPMPAAAATMSCSGSNRQTSSASTMLRSTTPFVKR